MHITYVGFGDFFRYAGMKQLYHFAQEISKLGHKTQILVPGDCDTVASMDEPPMSEILPIHFRGPFLARSVIRRVQAFNPDILHVWTPRHVPALTGWQLSRVTKAPVVLDHEDDERYLRRSYHESQGQRLQGNTRRIARPVAQLKGQLLPWFSPLKSDGNARRMAEDSLSSARIRPYVRAHSAISPALVRYVQQNWGESHTYLLYPGADLKRFCPALDGIDIRNQLGMGKRRLLVYTGTMNMAIFMYFVNVLEGVRARSYDAALLLVGNDDFRPEAEQWLQHHGLEQVVRLVGIVPYSQVPRFLASADILLQHPIDIGNELRLPAKLPEYLAMGKPLVMYSQGIGVLLDDQVHALKLHTVDPTEMVEMIVMILDYPDLANKLGNNARILAERLFDWKANASHLAEIYTDTLSRSAAF